MLTKIKQFFINIWKWIKEKIKRILIWLGILGVAVASTLTITDLNRNEISSVKMLEKYNQSDQIKKEYRQELNSLVKDAKDENSMAVVVGEKMETDFVPNIEFQRWENEVSLKIKPKIDGVATKDKTLGFEKNKIKFGTPKIEYNFYDLGITNETPEGGYEIEVILNEKPESNKIEFNIESRGLEFIYQPELPDSVLTTDKGGNPVYRDKNGNIRPENVVGSYAIYLIENKTNWIGGKIYGTGKFGHIFRPRIVDGAGNWIWGILKIEDDTMSVEIPQDFLDTAVYPIRHASGTVMGYNTAGGSYINRAGSPSSESTINGSLFASGGAGTLDDINVYLWGCSNEHFALAVYNSTLAKLSSTLEQTQVAAKQWYTAIAISGSISNANYWLVFNQATCDLYLYYDGGAANQGITKVQTYGTWPDPIATPSYNTNKYSIYANYTPTVVRRIIITE